MVRQWQPIKRQLIGVGPWARWRWPVGPWPEGGSSSSEHLDLSFTRRWWSSSRGHRSSPSVASATWWCRFSNSTASATTWPTMCWTTPSSSKAWKTTPTSLSSCKCTSTARLLGAGCDILLQMHQNGDMVEELKKLGIYSALLDETKD